MIDDVNGQHHQDQSESSNLKAGKLALPIMVSTTPTLIKKKIDAIRLAETG